MWALRKLTNLWISIHTNKVCLQNYTIQLQIQNTQLPVRGTSKLNEKELAHIIYTHNKVVNSGLPNYQGCKIPVKTRINVEFFRENLLDYYKTLHISL
jgi:hypothetical protein